MTPETFILLYPVLFHMAEANTWDSIKQHGLLSTSAILDLHGIAGRDRLRYESQHRPDMMTVASPVADPMTLRDQKPMSVGRLQQALLGEMSPQHWYELLNRKVFFWATPERLHTLLNAQHYRAVEHDVLTIDSRSFLSKYSDQIELCHMNSGNTFPMPHRRDESIFKRIGNYPTKANGTPTKPVAEVTVEYSVPNIVPHVISVNRMRGNELLHKIYAS
jgi:hypothetical protein